MLILFYNAKLFKFLTKLAYILTEVINMDAIVSLIGNVGFPIAVSIYLLVRIESKLESLTSSINNLSSVINTLEK